MYQKKVLFSNIIMQLSGTGRFLKRYFSMMLEEKMSKVNPPQQSGLVTAKLFFSKW